jgi:hypothetical protein
VRQESSAGLVVYMLWLMEFWQRERYVDTPQANPWRRQHPHSFHLPEQGETFITLPTSLLHTCHSVSHATSSLSHKQTPHDHATLPCVWLFCLSLPHHVGFHRHARARPRDRYGGTISFRFPFPLPLSCRVQTSPSSSERTTPTAILEPPK